MATSYRINGVTRFDLSRESSLKSFAYRNTRLCLENSKNYFLKKRLVGIVICCSLGSEGDGSCGKLPTISRKKQIVNLTNVKNSILAASFGAMVSLNSLVLPSLAQDLPLTESQILRNEFLQIIKAKQESSEMNKISFVSMSSPKINPSSYKQQTSGELISYISSSDIITPELPEPENTESESPSLDLVVIETAEAESLPLEPETDSPNANSSESKTDASEPALSESIVIELVITPEVNDAQSPSITEEGANSIVEENELAEKLQDAIDQVKDAVEDVVDRVLDSINDVTGDDGVSQEPSEKSVSSIVTPGEPKETLSLVALALLISPIFAFVSLIDPEKL